MKKVLITGGAGFIGSHIASLAHQQQLSITILDNLSTGSLDNISPLLDSHDVQFINADVNNKETIIDSFEGIDCVFHLAARISVPESMEYPSRYFQTNTQGTLNILECCKQHQVRKIILSSTSAIYGLSLIHI